MDLIPSTLYDWMGRRYPYTRSRLGIVAPPVLVRISFLQTVLPGRPDHHEVFFPIY